jgi:outer membrane protein TolC
MKRLTLQEALRTALENNFQVQIAQEARTATTAGVSIAQGAFDWNLVSSFNYGRQDSAMTRSLYPTGPLARTEATTWNRSLTLGVQKPFEWGGALQLNYSPIYGFSSGDYQDPNTGATLSRFGTKYPYSGSLSGTYSQNLLKGFGRAVNEVNVIVAKKSSQAADHQFSLAVINLVAVAEAQYWDLVFAARNLENAKAALALAQEQLDDNKAKVKVGTLPEIEVTSAEAAAAYRKQALILAKSQLRSANDALLRTLDPKATRSDRIEPAEAPDLRFELPEEAVAEKAALEHRLELKMARLSKESMIALRTAAENRLLPQLNAFATYNATSDNRTSLGPVNGDLSSSAYPGYTVGLSFAFPLANRAAKGSLAQARANERGSELSLRDLELGIRLQVRQAYENVEASRESAEAARLTRVFREEDLRAERKKFENGLSTTFLVLSKQNDLDASIAAELQAQIAFAKSITALEQATGHLLEARGFAGIK